MAWQENKSCNLPYRISIADRVADAYGNCNWRLTAGVDNVTDRYPAEITSKGNLNTNGIYRYSGFAPDGFNGRFF
jgi:outer membrane receptor protein involved in Fe transport